MRIEIIKILENITNSFVTYAKYGISRNALRMEASSVCQLKCPECPQTVDGLGVVGKGFLKFSDFKMFIEKYPEFKEFEISNYGEIFLNPEIKEIIKYAFEKGITLTAMNGVNLNTVSDDVLEALVKYRFKVMYVSLDGASKETYVFYRRGGDFEKVIKNIERINHFKGVYATEFPKMVWQFVVFGHNEKELPKARETAKKLGMGFVPKLNWIDDYSPVVDKESVKKEIGIEVSRNEHEERTGRIYNMPCSQLWFSPMINWDGKLLGCCINTWGDFGNVFTRDLRDAIRGEKYIYTKRMLAGEVPERSDIPCLRCSVYAKIKRLREQSRLPRFVFLRQMIWQIAGKIKKVM